METSLISLCTSGPQGLARLTMLPIKEREGKELVDLEFELTTRNVLFSSLLTSLFSSNVS